MKTRVLVPTLMGIALIVVVGGCSEMSGMSGMSGTSATSLFDQVGGMDQMRSLSDKFVGNLATDSRTSKMVSTADAGSAKSKMADQLCAMTGGGCAAPLNDAQIAEGAKKVDASQASAVSDSFNKALSSITTTPGVKETVTKAVGPKLSGIVGALL